MGRTCSANGHRQTAPFNYEIRTMREAKDDPAKDFATDNGNDRGHET